MNSLQPIPVSLHGRSATPSARFFARDAKSKSSSPDDGESNLLKAIRSTLKGSRGQAGSAVTSVTSSSYRPNAEEEELSWDTHTVVLSTGGVIVKRWNFEIEGQPVQWACIGWFEQPNSVFTSSTARTGAHAQDAEDNPDSPLPDPNQRPTFGPFSRQVRESKHQSDPGSRSRAVFVFLRGIGKVFFLNGLEYTFHLPFIVRSAWALSPHGVLLQRLLDASELDEAKASGDEPLPTLFTIVNPFAEAAVVGLGFSIKDGSPAPLDDVGAEQTVSSVPAQEEILWVSGRSADPTDQLFTTLDRTARTITLWHYVFVNSDTYSPPAPPTTTRNNTRHRQSVSGPLSPRRSSMHRHNLSFELPPEQPPLASLPGMPPALSTTVPMASIVPGAVPDVPWANAATGAKGARASIGTLGRVDLSFNIENPALPARTEPQIDPLENARMRPTYCAAKLYTAEVSEQDCQAWRDFTFGIFDRRWDGQREVVHVAMCLPRSSVLLIFPLVKSKEKIVSLDSPVSLSAISVAPMKLLRPEIDDLLIVKPGGSLAIVTYGLRELPLHTQPKLPIVTLRDPIEASVTFCDADNTGSRVTLHLFPTTYHPKQLLLTLAMVLPSSEFFALHHTFLLKWSTQHFVQDETTFDILCSSILDFLGLKGEGDTASPPSGIDDPWSLLGRSSTAAKFTNDIALRKLSMPARLRAEDPSIHRSIVHKFHASILNGLHHLAQCFLLSTSRHSVLKKLVPVICRLAFVVRPEWADYWKRLFPDEAGPWRSPHKSVPANLDERLPIWPTDVPAGLFGKLNNSDWSLPALDTRRLILPEGTTPSFAFGRQDPLLRTHQVHAIYQALADGKENTRKRAELALRLLTRSGDIAYDLLHRLPIGLSMPLHEAIRTSQLSPAGDWSPAAYQFIGRNDLAESGAHTSETLFTSGYRSIKDYILPTFSRRSISEHHEEVRKAMLGEVAAVTGVELGMEDYIETRFSQDKRLEEVGRILCSSAIPTIKTLERPELNEVDQTKEFQHYAMRVAERTLALPPGRALFTFGCVQVVTKEAYAVPRIEYSIRIQPQNVLVVPENGKIPYECSSWGDFHNGVAAGLRISPNATGVQSSWIKFNKPSELTPEHAGFLYALGLTGHLREMLTWHTFAYLTPKHDLTSIAILLGLSAANVGNGNRHVTKLIAVHTPALLPTPGIDLNVPLITQAAGLSGLGLLYMGTRNRRMAEVCLSQISRRDLVQPDLSNEYRESYTYCSALAFGMIMLGKGSDVPADLALLSRLRILIHGDGHTLGNKGARPAFDINLTSPAASIALGLMYLRTNRQDIADILTIPDTIVTLDRIQPGFLMIRALSRALIMWNSIAPTNEWLHSQIPDAIRVALDADRSKVQIHESLDLACWNIIAGSCFALSLKYAGTASQEAGFLVMRYYDKFTHMSYTNTPAFEQRIKRSAIRDGLNLLSISLNIIMAGSGDIGCLRRLRYAFGLYHPPVRYGTHVAIHQSIGLLFLGGGRYTLGTSDAAIAAMVTAFFPRFSQVSSDNKSYLQALRHLWVLAVEPRSLVARDVDTKEVVFLPVKFKIKDENETGTVQLVMPTLVPDIDRIQSLRVDTPRYWPFYMDIANLPQHKEALLRNQTLFVKRRTAFLSYIEDPKGSRSLFFRSGSSAGDAAVLDFPQLKNADTHPATDLHHFISSYSNDPFFLAFADRFCREDSETDDEKLFFAYCYATLHDSILQDKPRTIQTHLTLYRYRRMPLSSPDIVFAHQDVKFAYEFYNKIYDRRFSGRAENNPRPALLRESTLRSALHELEGKLESLRPSFEPLLRHYARGSDIPAFEPGSASFEMSRALAWYLQRNSVPAASVLLVLGSLADNSRTRCLEQPPPQGTTATLVLEEGIKEVVQKAGSQLISSIGSGWSLRCVEEIMAAWERGRANAAAGATATSKSP